MRVTPGLAQLGIYSCGRDTDPQPNAQYIFDVSDLRNPMSNRGFRHKFANGIALPVREYVKEDPRVEAILDSVALIAHMQFRGNPTSTSTATSLPWLSFAFKDHHGIWIAPAMAEIAVDSLIACGYAVSVFHFGLNKVTT